MKTIFKLLLFCFVLFACSLKMKAQQFAYFDEYTNLYPDCVDNDSSQVYSLDQPFLEEPLFPGGGQVEMTRFVYFSTKYPDVKGSDGKQLKGKVLIRTVIDRCGVAGQIEVIQSLSDEQDAEAIRIVESFPLFKPATLDGERVKVEITVPVYFTKTFVPKPVEPEYNYDEENYSW